MNILASYNWIKEYADLKHDARHFARELSLSGPSVERIYPQAPAFENMVVGKVVEVEPHPDADKLRIAITDIGGRKGARIVCGGENLARGMKVAVALPGAKVRWHGEGEPVELQSAKIRGVTSEGMICGASEISLEEVITHGPGDIADIGWCKAEPGTPLAEALDLDDTAFDIEVTTNRPDTFSMVGLAREASAILGETFTWKAPEPPERPKSAHMKEFGVENRAPELCTRYEAVVMDGITVGESPWWLKNRLRMSGVRPINNIVDISNYVMLEYGQPMHAFDYSRLIGKRIIVRTAADGEKILTLDGEMRELKDGQLVIADAQNPVAVAGVMGGEKSGVRDDTRTIVFESATFDPVSVRRTARALVFHSDSSVRFEKGLSEEQTDLALHRAIELCREVAGGRVASRVFDDWQDPRKPVRFPFRTEKAEALIGVKIPEKRMVAILTALGFKATKRKPGNYEVEVPYWRVRDIEDERDFSEEIARVYGYQNLPSVLPEGRLPAELPLPSLEAEDRARRFLQSAGYTETITYSFISGEEMEKAGEDTKEALRVANPLSSDFEYMRTSLIPGILSAIAGNEGLFPEGKCFEVSNVYYPVDGDLPRERLHVLATSYGPEAGDTHFREMKGLAESYLRKEGAREIVFTRTDAGNSWHPGRSAEVAVEGRAVGIVSEAHPSVLGRFGIEGRVAFMVLDMKTLLGSCVRGHRYEPPLQFPSVLRDLAFVVDDRIEYGRIEEEIMKRGALPRRVYLFDVYRGKGIEEGRKSVAVHLEFTHPERTLTAEEVDEEMGRIAESLGEEFGASVRS